MSMNNERISFIGMADKPPKYSSFIDRAKEIGFTSIFLIAKPNEIIDLRSNPSLDYWKPALQHLHDLGMKLHLVVAQNKYAWWWTWTDTNNDGIKDKWVKSTTNETFYLKQHNPRSSLTATELVTPPPFNPNIPSPIETIPYDKCMSDLDFMLNVHMIDSNGKGLDGIHLEEPHLHVIYNNPIIEANARAFYNKWFSVGDAETPGIRSLIGEARMSAGFDYGWNHTTISADWVYQMGTDLQYINTHPTFSYFIFQNNATEYDKSRVSPPITTDMVECKWDSPITNWLGSHNVWITRLSSMTVISCIYLTSSSILRSPQCGTKWYGAACFNQNAFNYINWCVKNNTPIYIFLMGYMHFVRSNFQVDSPAGANSGDIIKTIFETIPGDCIPNWQCEPGETGYEIDGCGNKRLNPICGCPTPQYNYTITQS